MEKLEMFQVVLETTSLYLEEVAHLLRGQSTHEQYISKRA